MTAAARTGTPPGGTPNPVTGNAAVIAAYGDAPAEEVFAALDRARAACAAYFSADDYDVIRRRPVATPVGPLPLTSAVHSVCYELAVHAVDLTTAGAPAPDGALLDAGLAALIDVTGSLAAARGLHITVSAVAEAGGWRFTSETGGWRTERAAGEPPAPHTAVRGAAKDLLDASAGRVLVPALLATRRLHVDDLPTFLRLAPLIDAIPHLPGGLALRGAGRVLRTATGLLGRLGLPL